MKSFNPHALRGNDYTDHEFKADLLESSDINIPDYLLYKPAMNDYVLEQVYNNSLRQLQEIPNPNSGQLYTAEEAAQEAGMLRSQAKTQLTALMAE